MVQMKTNDVLQLEECVRKRVWGQVKGLRLKLLDRGILLQGRSPSFYLKQLAQQAVLESSRVPLAANEIEVAKLN